MQLTETKVIHDCCLPDYEYKANAHSDNPVLRCHIMNGVEGGVEGEHYNLQICQCECHREQLGKLVREAWVEWAQNHVNPKPHWLQNYENLAESDKEADRQIGEKLLRKFLSWVNPSAKPRAAVKSLDKEPCGKCGSPQQSLIYAVESRNTDILAALASQPQQASPITREQVEFCFKQATQAGRFSQAYCVDRLLELLHAARAAEAKRWGGTHHEARWAGAGCPDCDHMAELEAQVPVDSAANKE